jgi:hypothetical protein
MRGLLKLFMRGINPKRTKNTETPKRRLFTQPSQEKLGPSIHLAILHSCAFMKKTSRQKAVAMHAKTEKLRGNKKDQNATVKL